MIRCGQDRNLHEGGFPGSEPLKTGLLRDRIGGCYRSSTPGGVINPIPRWIRGGSNHQMSSRLSPWGLHRLGSRRRLGRRPSQARTPFPSKGRGRGTGRRYCFRFRLMAHATREFERLTIGRKARRSRYLHARGGWCILIICSYNLRCAGPLASSFCCSRQTQSLSSPSARATTLIDSDSLSPNHDID